MVLQGHQGLPVPVEQMELTEPMVLRELTDQLARQEQMGQMVLWVLTEAQVQQVVQEPMVLRGLTDRLVRQGLWV